MLFSTSVSTTARNVENDNSDTFKMLASVAMLVNIILYSQPNVSKEVITYSEITLQPNVSEEVMIQCQKLPRLGALRLCSIG